MQFEFTPPQTEAERFFGGFFRIHALGRILPGDDERFLAFLEQSDAPPRADLYIDSVGGDVEAGMSLGRIIRDAWLSTHVGSALIDHTQSREFILPRRYESGSCLSAATLMFIGGRLRYFPSGSRFGVHQFSFKNPTPEHVGRSQILSASIARFIADMGVAPEFLEVSSSTSGDQLRLLSAEDLERLNVVTGGQTSVSWSIQAADTAIYARGERDSLYGHHKMLLGFQKPNGFWLMAVIESQGRENELSTFPLVELVIGQSEQAVIAVADRCRRQVNGIYTNIDVWLTNEEALAIAQSDGFGLRVRGGPDAGMFLGIAPMDTKNGRHLLEAMVHNLT